MFFLIQECFVFILIQREFISLVQKNGGVIVQAQKPHYLVTDSMTKQSEMSQNALPRKQKP